MRPSSRSRDPAAPVPCVRRDIHWVRFHDRFVIMREYSSRQCYSTRERRSVQKGTRWDTDCDDAAMNDDRLYPDQRLKGAKRRSGVLSQQSSR